MTDIKILGLMLASNNCEAPNKCYKQMVEACQNTWIQHSHPNVKVYSIYGNDYTDSVFTDTIQHIIVNDNNIFINTPERRDNLLKKTIKAMEYCLNQYNDYDYFFRPNCGSYINTSLLYKFLYNKPKNRYYSAINGLYNGIKFASGSCILMSKDVVEFLVNNQHKLEYNGSILMDDVAIGQLLLDNGYELSNDAIRQDCYHEQHLMNKFNKDCYHYYFCHTINPKLIYLCHNLTIENKVY